MMRNEEKLRSLYLDRGPIFASRVCVLTGLSFWMQQVYRTVLSKNVLLITWNLNYRIYIRTARSPYIDVGFVFVQNSTFFTNRRLI